MRTGHDDSAMMKGALAHDAHAIQKADALGDIDFSVPKGVAAACARGLELAPEYGGRGLTSGARARARNMASGKSISAAQAKRMHSFFSRHTEEKEASPPSPGYVAWLLWGGDAGRAWADKLTSQINGIEKKEDAVEKAVMERLAPLGYARRIDYQALIAAGIPPAEARAIVQAYQPVKKAAPTGEYLRAFHQASFDKLPGWQHVALHTQARASAGGQRNALARKVAANPIECAREEKDALLSRLAELDAILAEEEDRALSAEAATDAIIKRALEPMPVYQDQSNPENPLPEGADTQAMQLLRANALVQGMDSEMQAGAENAEEARAIASRALTEQPDLYRHLGEPTRVRGLAGLMLDIGCGQNREPGHIGLDIQTFNDYGIALHDACLGLPFEDGAARVIRMHDALHDILDANGEEGDPMPLLVECQRVLMEGGILNYQGPEPLYEEGEAWPLPGLALAETNGDDAGGKVTQVLVRVPIVAPAFVGADARYAAAPETSAEEAMRLIQERDGPAQLAMAHLINKAAGDREVPIIKATDKQIIYGEVLKPDTVDLQGDYMTAQDIEAAAHGFLQDSRLIKMEHDKPTNATVLESYLAPSDMVFDTPAGKKTVTKGTWLLAVRINDPKVWAKVRAGEITGFSVGGFGQRDAVGQTNN